MDLKNPSGELQTAIDAAKTGGKVALKYFKTELTVKKKYDNTILTIADPDVENTIKQQIIKKFPDAKFLAEESGGNVEAKDIWIIDPIDGTRIFARGIEQWAILIAHYYKDEITVGVCYLPTQDILVCAEKGKGAFLNGERITVSSTAHISEILGSFGSINRFTDRLPLRKLLEAGVHLRSYEHSYAVSLVASGKMDLVIDAYGLPWDYAPFIRIIEEAGGKITDYQGNPWKFESKELLVTNGVLHDEILKILNT